MTGLEVLLRDVNALKKLILMEGEGAENNTKAAITVTLTGFNVESLLVVILRKTVSMMLVTMLITPSVINHPLAAYIYKIANFNQRPFFFHKKVPN